jgi:hypothetical protein
MSAKARAIAWSSLEIRCPYDQKDRSDWLRHSDTAKSS